MKRVGVVRGMDSWTGAENWRKLAVARLRSTVEAEVAEEASSILVGMQGLSDAIDCRNSTRGSCCAASEVAIVVDGMRKLLKVVVIPSVC